MNQDRDNSPDNSIARLIRLAGTRDTPSADATRRAREAAEAAWQRGLASAAEPRRGRRYVIPLALAAGLALIATVAVRHQPGPREIPVVAVVAAVDSGPVQHAPVHKALTAQMPLPAGTTVATGAGRAAFLLGDYLSLRADRDTQLEFVALERVRLLRGRLYVDSGGLNVASRLRIETPAGEVRHFGTQFLVAVDGTATRIRVREGRVALARGDAIAHDIAAGDALEVDGTRVRLLQDQPASGAEWEWATHTAPSFDIENRPLAEFLAWIAREHGWQLTYADESLRLRAHDIRLHGSVAGLGAAAMLERVELITGVRLRAQDGVLHVDAATS